MKRNAQYCDWSSTEKSRKGRPTYSVCCPCDEGPLSQFGHIHRGPHVLSTAKTYENMLFQSTLKGLSYEIDFENVDEN